MSERPDFMDRFHRVRRKEIEIVFSHCPEKHFATALELGAGDGFHSRLLAKYATKLISTDYSPSILALKNTESIEYRVCDAEEVDHCVGGESFDLVFMSSVMEHLSNPVKALQAAHKILREDGVVVSMMPNRFWKACHLAFHLPNKVFLKMTHPRGGNRRPIEEKTIGVDNNPKTVKAIRSKFVAFWTPEPHGVSKSNLDEIMAWKPERWSEHFEEAGFEPPLLIKGPVSSGYSFGFDFAAHFLERIGIASEYAYIAAKRGTDSPHIEYFKQSG